MSFILDALKKSENDRQQQAPAEFSTVPSSPDSPVVPRWLWALGALLAINLAVLIGLLMRPDTPEPTALPKAIVATGSPGTVTNRASNQKFEDQVSRARQSQTSVGATAPIAEVPESAVDDIVTPAPATDTSYLPSLTELRVEGRMQLPEMHIDIHVFADTASDRFVFINMNKYRERDQLTEGPLVREITRDGVILEYRGIAFVLPRE